MLARMRPQHLEPALIWRGDKCAFIQTLSSFEMQLEQMRVEVSSSLL